MATTTVYAKGHDWGDSIFTSETWGGETSPEDAARLGQAVVERFHEVCQAAGRDDVVWFPRLGEVHGNNDDSGLPAIDLDALREQAGDEVFGNPERYLGA